MYDQGAADTDKLIAELEERIRIEYTQAEREIKKKLDDYLKAFRIKDRQWQVWVEADIRTKQEYLEWKTGQIAIGQRWEEMRETIATDLLNANKIALSIAREYCADAYALNHDYGTYQIEHDSLTDTSYTLYNRDTAQRVLRGDIQLLPEPGKKVSQAIKDGRAMRWNKSHIQSVMMQSLLQGNSIPDIATRLSNAVGESDRKAATRNARTMMTNAQNTGRLDSFKRAEGMGIPVKKQWVATLDMRTRHEHRVLDGMVQDLDKPFVVEGEPIMKPGDPNAAPQLVYNCRCTMRASIKGYEHDLSDTSLRHDKKLGDMTYDEWKQGRAVSKPILSQEQTGEAIRAKYIRQYRGYGGPVASGRDMTLDIDSKKVQKKAPFESTNIKKALGADYDAFRAKVEDAPTRPLYEKYGESIRLIHVKDGSVYNRATNSIKFDFATLDGLDRYSTIAHEFGHAFDNNLGKVPELSFSEIDLINDRCKIGSGMTKPLREVPSSSDEFLTAVRTDMEALKPRLNDGTLKTEMMATNESRNATAGIQDALDGAFSTQKNGVFPWGHGEKYYNRRYNDYFKTFGNTDKLKDAYQSLGFDASNQTKVKRLARVYETANEAWANVSSAVTCGGAELEAFEAYMPETLRVYRDIVERVTNDVT